MTIVPHSLERWLVLDEPVWDAVRVDPGDPQGLLSLRLAYGLVEQASRETIRQRLAALAATGVRTVHVVAEQPDVKLFSHLRAAATERFEVHVHDWYQSPLGVMASLDAPDMELVARIASSDRDVLLAIWPPVDPFGEGVPFRRRYRAALAGWERDARTEHGEAFEELYGSSIPWERLLPDTITGNARRLGVTQRLHGWIRAVAERGGFALSAGLPASAAAIGDGSVGGQPLNWTYKLSDGGEVGFRIDLPSLPGANVEVFAVLGPGIEKPAGFVLVEETGQIIVSAVTSRWVPAGTADRRLVSHHSFSDEFGELRERFQRLRVQPELLLLPAQATANGKPDSIKH